MPNNNKTLDLIDCLIAKSAYHDTRSLIKARQFIIAVLSVVIVNLAVQVYFIALSELPIENIYIALRYTGLLIGGSIATIVLFRVSGSYTASTHLILLTTFLVINRVIIDLGGPLEGTSVVMSFLPPILAFLLLGFASGIAWTLITYFTLLTGSIMAMSGFEFPNVDTEEHQLMGRTLHWHVGFLCVFAIVAVYEFNNSQYRRKLEQLATHDWLTGLKNRYAFYKTLQRWINNYKSKNLRFTILFLDLNNFKSINDTLGHSAGDQALKTLGTRLQRISSDHTKVFRLGGDEFAVISEEQALDAAVQAIDIALEKPVKIGEHNVKLDASVGKANFPDEGHDINTLLHKADMKMYTEKGSF